MSGKEIIGGLAVMLGLGGTALYLWQIYRHAIKPHVFSWVVWGMLMSIAFAAQHVEKAGPGSWSLGVGALSIFIIAAASFFYGERDITRSDWMAFILALSAIPVWVATSNPLWAVIIVTGIDSIAFYPTFRKSWIKPAEEGAVVFSMTGVQLILSIFALEKYTLVTVLYPATMVILNMAVASMVLYRRRMLA